MEETRDFVLHLIRAGGASNNTGWSPGTEATVPPSASLPLPRQYVSISSIDDKAGTGQSDHPEILRPGSVVPSTPPVKWGDSNPPPCDTSLHFRPSFVPSLSHSLALCPAHSPDKAQRPISRQISLGVWHHLPGATRTAVFAVRLADALRTSRPSQHLPPQCLPVG